MNKTEIWALSYLYRRAYSFFARWTQGKLETMFFIRGMVSNLNDIETFIRENGGQAANSNLPDIGSGPKPVTLEDLVNRTHEECCECSLENVSPPQCMGHVAGPTSCKSFKPK